MKSTEIKFTAIPSTEEVKAERDRLAYRSRYGRVLRSTIYALVVVAAVLDGHAPRENPVDHTVRGMDHQRKVGLQQVVVIEFGRGEIGQQHGGDHALK